MGEHVQTPDELEQDFTSNDFADIRAIHDQMLEESDIDWHKEVSEKIIDIKTSIYHTTKEKKYYQKYCEELVIIHLNELQAINTEAITYISAETLKNQLYDQSLIQEISGIQKKMDLDFLINDFDKRIAF